MPAPVAGAPDWRRALSALSPPLGGGVGVMVPFWEASLCTPLPSRAFGIAPPARLVVPLGGGVDREDVSLSRPLRPPARVGGPARRRASSARPRTPREGARVGTRLPEEGPSSPLRSGGVSAQSARRQAGAPASGAGTRRAHPREGAGARARIAQPGGSGPSPDTQHSTTVDDKQPADTNYR